MSDKTAFVACTHASNVLGTIHDVRAIAAEVHKVPGALLCVDGVALAPHRGVDVGKLGVDFYAFSWYKVPRSLPLPPSPPLFSFAFLLCLPHQETISRAYSPPRHPHGLSFSNFIFNLAIDKIHQVYGPHNATLYASPFALSHLHSLAHYFHTPATSLATSSYELVAALPAIVSYFGPDRPATWAQIAAHEEVLQSILLDYLRSRQDVTIYGDSSADNEVRVPVVSFTVEGWSSRAVVEGVEACSGFACRWGHFYSKRLVDDVLGLGGEKGGVVRVSMVHYNTGEWLHVPGREGGESNADWGV